MFDKPNGYHVLAIQRRAAAEAEEQARIKRTEFVAICGETTLVGATFSEVGDQLIARGYLMHEAWGGEKLLIPHPELGPAEVTSRLREA